MSRFPINQKTYVKRLHFSTVMNNKLFHEKVTNSQWIYLDDLGSVFLSQVDFDVVLDNLKKLRENCKKSWEYLSIVAKHDSTKQLKSK